jgi:hypothetical protein
MMSGMMHNPNQHIKKPSSLSFVLVLLCCSVVAAATFILTISHPNNQQLVGLDFRAHYTAGRMLLAGAPLYDLSQQWAWQKSLWPQLSTQAELLYIPYPPFDILPMALVAQFPLPTAYFLWLIAETVLLSILCYSLVNVPSAISTRARIAILLLCLTSLPVFLTLVHGQLSFVLALAVFFAWQNCKAGHDRRGGLWLSLLLVKPQFFVIPFLLFLALRRGRVLQGLLSGSAILLLLSLFIIGPNGLRDYVQLLTAASQWGEGYGIHPQEMQSWRSLLHRLLDTPNPSQTLWPWLIGVIVTLGLTISIWRHRPQESCPNALFDIQWAVLLFATTFCSPHLNIHDLSLLIVAGVLMFNAAIQATHNRNLHLLLLCLPVIGHGLLWIDFAFAPVIPPAIPFQIVTLFALTYACRFLSPCERQIEPAILSQT